MEKELKRLLEFTKACRDDMHEPDEQEISAMVVGDHLDNAHGHRIHYAEDFTYQEFVVVLNNDSTGKEERFNLATLIALARKANLKK